MKRFKRLNLLFPKGYIHTFFNLEDDNIFCVYEQLLAEQRVDLK